MMEIMMNDKKIYSILGASIIILLIALAITLFYEKAPEVLEDKSNLWDICLEQTIDDPSMTEDYYEIYQPAINKSLKFRRII